MTPLVDKSLRQAGLGLNPQKVDATTLSVPLPKVTGDTRIKLLKSIKDLSEKSKVNIRMARKDARSALNVVKKSLASDIFKRNEKEIDLKTDLNIKNIDSLVLSKEKQILNTQ